MTVAEKMAEVHQAVRDLREAIAYTIAPWLRGDDGELWFIERQWSGNDLVLTHPQNYLWGERVDIEVHTPVAVRVVAHGAEAEQLARRKAESR